MPATPLLLLLATILLASCGGDKHLPSSNPPEYDPKQVYLSTSPASNPSIPQPAKPVPQTTPPAPPMDPEALRQAIETADRTRDILEKAESLDATAQLHAILEAMMNGKQAPLELRPTFMESFGPRKAQIHQAFDKQYVQLQQALDEELKFPTMQLPLRKSSGFEPFASYRVDMRRRQVAGKPWIHLVGVEMLPRGTTVSLEPDCCGRWKIITIPESAFEGEGFNLEIKSAGRYEADKDHFSIDSEAITATTKVVIGDKATINVKILKKNRAVVNRCPSASGVVPGEASIYEEMGYHVSMPTAINRAGIFVHDQAKTEAHTDEEGLVQEITMDITAEDLDGETGQVLRQASGKAVKKRDMPVVCSGCTTRVADAAKKLGKMASWNYFNAELKWRKPEYKADACVKIHFTPATKTVTLAPGASTKVKAQLRTVADDQATEGRLFELQELKGGKVTPQDEKTAPQSPAVFTFTAPNRRWSKSMVPGFRVHNSSSRAGGASRDEEWEVADGGMRLRIANRIWHDPGSPYALSGYAQFDGTVQFEIQLERVAEGWFRGEMMTLRPLVVRHVRPAAHPCAGSGSQTEHWQVSAHVDHKTESMVLHWGFTDEDGQASWTCTGPAGTWTDQLTILLFSHDDLHNVQMPTKTGTKKELNGRDKKFLEWFSVTVVEGMD